MTAHVQKAGSGILQTFLFQAGQRAFSETSRPKPEAPDSTHHAEDIQEYYVNRLRCLSHLQP